MYVRINTAYWFFPTIVRKSNIKIIMTRPKRISLLIMMLLDTMVVILE